MDGWIGGGNPHLGAEEEPTPSPGEEPFFNKNAVPSLPPKNHWGGKTMPGNFGENGSHQSGRVHALLVPPQTKGQSSYKMEEEFSAT